MRWFKKIAAPVVGLIKTLTTLLDRDKPDLLVLRANDSPAAVVFIHGFGGDMEETWGKFPEFLMSEPGLQNWDVYSYGYPTSLRVDIPGIWVANPPINVLADAFAGRFQHDPLKRYRSVTILAHSMGGLVVQRALVSDPSIATRVTHVVLFGTPSAGLSKAALGRRGRKQVRDMIEGGEFIRGLRRDWDSTFGDGRAFKFFAVAGRMDSFVPVDSSLSPFAVEQRRTIPGDHLQIVKPQNSTELSVRIVCEALKGRAAPRGPWDSALVAVELGEFKKVIQQLEPRVEQLDEDAAVALALAYDGVGRNSDAIKVLTDRKNRGLKMAEPWNVFGGRYKRRWLLERTDAALQAAVEAYTEGLRVAMEGKVNHDQAMYACINLAFLALVSVPANESRIPTPARVLAQQALDHASKADVGVWRHATEAEAKLYFDGIDAACASYGQAIALAGQREIDSMFTQAVRVAERIGGPKHAARIYATFGHGEAIDAS
jgi:pimeloyl-ACP methyl ester carboxylesterase